MNDRQRQGQTEMEGKKIKGKEWIQRDTSNKTRPASQKTNAIRQAFQRPNLITAERGTVITFTVTMGQCSE